MAKRASCWRMMRDIPFSSKPILAIRTLLDHEKRARVSVMHDIIDWVGGSPFEFVNFELLES